MNTSDDLAKRSASLRWRSRRGLLELELLLLPFVESLQSGELDDLTPELLDQYQALLELEDLDIYDWLLAASNPAVASSHPAAATDPAAPVAAIIEYIGRFHRARGG